MSNLITSMKRDCRIAEAAAGLLVAVFGALMAWAWSEMDAGNPTGLTGVIGSGFGVALFVGMGLFVRGVRRSLGPDDTRR
ncbi:hypothetical protein ACWEF6_02695 [Amycolatopsis sp. NPDC004772]